MEKSDDELVIQEDKKRRGIDRFSFKLPFVSGELSGQHVVFGIVMLFVVAPVMTGMYFHHIENTKTSKEVISRLGKVEEATTKSNETLEAMIYVISLSQADKEKLQLVKPPKVRDMERSSYGRDYNGR